MDAGKDVGNGKEEDGWEFGRGAETVMGEDVGMDRGVGR
jgi:hypothetical protein